MKNPTHIEIEGRTEEMPPWLAHITASLNDGVSRGAWPDLALRYGTCAREWYRLDADAWSRVEAAVKISALAVGRETVSVDEWGVLPAISEAVRLLSDGGSDEEWDAARHAAWEATWAARDAMAAGIAASRDATEAGMVARYATSKSACAADRAAITAAWAAFRVAARGDVAGWDTTEAATWDRIAGALLDALEREIAEVATDA